MATLGIEVSRFWSHKLYYLGGIHVGGIHSTSADAVSILGWMCCCILIVLRIAMGWKGLSRLDRICRCVIVIALCVGSFLFSAVRGPGAIPFLDGFLVTVNREMDPVRLKCWAQSELSQESTNANESVRMLPVDKIPVSLRTLNKKTAAHACIVEDDPGRHIEIAWGGGGYGCWGVAVGIKGAVLPTNSWFYSRPWQDGIFVYYAP